MQGDSGVERWHHPSHHPHAFQLVCRQTPQHGWHHRPNPQERKRALAVICPPDLSHYSLQLIASPYSRPFPGRRHTANGSAANCNMSGGLKAVIQISLWPLGRKGCFSPSFQGANWMILCVCVCASILVRRIYLCEDILARCNLTSCFYNYRQTWWERKSSWAPPATLYTDKLLLLR